MPKRGEVAEGQRPDLALVDLNLHDGLTGPQIASDLSCGKSVVVVFVTGSPDQIPLDYAGAIGAITKPWFPRRWSRWCCWCAHSRGRA